MNDLITTTLANAKYYRDSNEIIVSNNILEIFAEYDGYICNSEGIYYSLIHQKYELPKQGWKIHISLTIDNALQVLEQVGTILNKKQISFKVMKSLEILQLSSQKYFPRGSSGKFITIYPKDEEQFIKLIEYLYQMIDGYGPYILSDRRYKDSKCIFYRYGGIKPDYFLDFEGNIQYFLVDKDGKKIVDERRPQFFLPKGVEDPFEKYFLEFNQYQPHILTKKYNIKTVEYMSNSGGIYIAVDNLNSQYLLKEARPFTVQLHENIDAISLLNNATLVQSKIQTLNISPKVFETFSEWEHHYSVEEYIKGTTLEKFVASNNPILKKLDTPNKDHFYIYFINVIELFTELLQKIDLLHSKGWIHGDLSLDNVLIDENCQIILIDFESSQRIDDINWDNRIYKKEYSKLGLHGKQIDYFALGHILINMIVPQRGEANSIGYSLKLRSLEKASKDFHLPAQILESVHLLIENYSSLSNLVDITEKMKLSRKLLSYNEIRVKSDLTFGKLEEIANLISKSIVYYQSYNNLSEVYYENSLLYSNYYNMFNGSFGVEFALSHYNSSAIDFKRLVSSERNNYLHQLPIGLANGLAGMLLVAVMQKNDFYSHYYATIIMNKIDLHDDLGFFHGISGVGLSLVKFYKSYPNSECFVILSKITQRIISEIQSGSTLDDITLESGMTGWIVYLAEFSEISIEINIQKYLEMVVNHVYSHLDINDDSVSIILNGVNNPYLAKGAAGVLWALTITIKKGFKIFTKYAQVIADRLCIKYSVSPSFCYGLSGIGYVMTEYYELTREVKYLEYSKNIADGVILFAIQEEDRIVFCDHYQQRISFDLASGSSGILLFLSSLLKAMKSFPATPDEMEVI